MDGTAEQDLYTHFHSEPVPSWVVVFLAEMY